jgi:hypothetical protein
MTYLRNLECTDASTEHISINCVWVYNYILVYLNLVCMYRALTSYETQNEKMHFCIYCLVNGTRNTAGYIYIYIYIYICFLMLRQLVNNELIRYGRMYLRPCLRCYSKMERRNKKKMHNKRNSSHDWNFARNLTHKTQKCNPTDSTALLCNLSFDNKISPCSECCILSFGWFPGIRIHTSGNHP